MKNDGWANVLTGIGAKATDKHENTSFVLRNILTRQELAELYRGEGVGKRIVDIPAQDMVRNWFKLEGDTQNSVVKYLNGIHARPEIKKALTQSRLFGGSLLVMLIDDGRSGKDILSKPLREKQIRGIRGLRVYERFQVTWNTQDLDPNPDSENFNKPEWYTVTPSVETPSHQFKVHHTRSIRFNGEELPEREAAQNRWWGDSVLQALYVRLRGFGQTMISVESIIEEFIIGVLTIENLQDLVSTTKGSKNLTKRLQQIDMSKHILNTFLVDKEEDYKRIAAQVSGIKDILDFFKDVLSAVAGIPQIKLFGEQSKGLGSQAAGNIRMYYDDIAEMQENRLRPALERLVEISLLSSDYRKRFGRDVKEWDLVFEQLWQMSAKEWAETRKLQAQADKIYLDTASLTPEEIAESRFGGDTYSVETRLTKKGRDFRKAEKPPVHVVKPEETEDPPEGDPDDDGNKNAGTSGPT